jgi:hypothetical protein
MHFLLSLAKTILTMAGLSVDESRCFGYGVCCSGEENIADMRARRS